MSLLPAEVRLFFVAVTPPSPGGDAMLASLVAAGPDWRAVVRIAEHERLTPVLWKRLRAIGAEVPAEVASALARRTVVSDFRMAATAAVLDRVLQRLAALEIPVLLLKGAALARSLYPAFTDRPMNDLDILVPAPLAERAWTAIHDAGWAIECEHRAEFYPEFHHLAPLVEPSGAGIVLEVHRALMPRPGPFILPDHDVWRDAWRVTWDTGAAWVPSDEHQLLHLGVHLAWSHLLDHGIARTVRDIATLLARRAPDWDAVTALARDTRAASSAYWTLALTRTLVDAPVPGEVLAALRPRQPAAATRALERAYILTGVLGRAPSVLLSRALWSAGMHPRRSGHGTHRPWRVTEHFQAVDRAAPPMPLPARLRAHLRDAGAWLRFAREVRGRDGIFEGP